jgi:hypothetical protein
MPEPNRESRSDAAMTEIPASSIAWWARGLLFENCSCQAICPGHVHFDQTCYHERCVGYWAIRFDAGEFDGVDLAGAKAVVAYDCPPHMIDGDWVEGIVIDAAAGDGQREAVEAILTGAAGGPWAVLARFVGRQLETRHAPISIDDDERSKRVVIEGILDSTITGLKGRDRSKPVMFANMFNQIHPSEQVIATGSSRYDDGTIRFANDDTHGLYSRFEWRVAP